MIAREKQILRAKVKAAIRAFPGKAAASERIAQRLHRSDLWRRARIVYAFSPLSSEPAWRRPEEEGGKVLAFPRITGEAMLFYTGGDLRPGRLGALEPEGGGLAPPPDLILVPGLAFDGSGHRLGRGGGFYDRWLAEKGAVPALGLCFDCQIVGEIPREGHDIRVDAWLTEERAYPRAAFAR